jgi:Cu2+-containing amine oxidase
VTHAAFRPAPVDFSQKGPPRMSLRLLARLGPLCGLCVLCALLSTPPSRTADVTQHFPANKPAAGQRTRWRVEWGIKRHLGNSEVLFIKEAHFARSPKEPEIKVLGDCRLAEIFVPYNDGTRIYDLSAHSFSLVDLGPSALGPNCVIAGTMYDRSGKEVKTGGVVVKEVHDGHIRWMDGSNKLLRGQNMTLWSVLNGANYRYVILYEFRDDGVVGFRLGATAHNLNSSDDPRTTHLHAATWRLNVELGNAAKTKVSCVRLDTAASKLAVEDVNKEARLKWAPESFTRLRVESLVHTNKHQPPHPISYELVPQVSGLGRYGGTGEQFTQHDLWVTRTQSYELRVTDLPRYENGESIVSGPVTLWHHTPILHAPRDEDFGVKGSNAFEGVAIMSWAGCELKPRNFFPATPLYP